jgi:hypothetical protein
MLTLNGHVTCEHMATVRQQAGQTFVQVASSPVLVEPDPIGRPVVACPIPPVNNKPCTTTRTVEVGYSRFVRIGGHAVCLDTLRGKTNGIMGGEISYLVRRPGQDFVDVAS